MSNYFPRSGLTLCLILILSSIFGCETDYSFDCEQCEFKDCHNGNVFCFDCFGSRGDLFESCPNGCENGKCLSSADCSIKCEEHNRSCGTFMDCDCGDCLKGLSCVEGSCIEQSGDCSPCKDDNDCSDGDCFLIGQNGSKGRYCLPSSFNEGSSICSYCPNLTSFGCCSSVSDCEDCSSWGSCSYATTCSESGTKLRSCPSCKYYTCSTVSESSACSRNTDGISCGTDKVCSDGYCTNACQCSSGPCCDGCNYYSSAHKCDDLTEFDCNGGCGGTVVKRSGIRNCSGTSGFCTGSVNWDNWSDVAECPYDWICEASGDKGSCKAYTGSDAKLTLNLKVEAKTFQCSGLPCGSVTISPAVGYSVNCNPSTSACSVAYLNNNNKSDVLTVPAGQTRLYYRVCGYISSSSYNNNCCGIKDSYSKKCDGFNCKCEEWKSMSFTMGCKHAVIF